MSWEEVVRKLELCRSLLKERSLEQSGNPLSLAPAQAGEHVAVCRFIDQAVDRYLTKLYHETTDASLLLLPVDAERRSNKPLRYKNVLKPPQRQSDQSIRIQHRSCLSLLEPISRETYTDIRKQKKRKTRVVSSLD